MRTQYNDAFSALWEAAYTDWARTFSPALVSYLNDKQRAERSVLDLCCGIGISVRAFCDAGWYVVGLDHSPAMLERAATRVGKEIEGGRALLWESHAADFQLPVTVGACVSLDGALNHLESVDELQQCFQSVRRALRPGGQFVFDLLQPFHFRHWRQPVVVDRPGLAVTRRGRWNDRSRIGTLRVVGRLDSLTVDQTLHARAFTEAEVEGALAGAGLGRVECDLAGGPCCPADTTEHGVPSPGRLVYRALRVR